MCGGLAWLASACSTTLPILVFGHGEVAFEGLSDVVAGCEAAVLGAGWSSRAGCARFRCSGGSALIGRMLLNPRRTRAGVSRPGAAGFSQGRRRSSARGRARPSRVWAAMTIQVQRSAASGARSLGRVQPRDCLNSRNVCSRSNLRRWDCHQRSMSEAVAPVAEDRSHTGLGSRSPGGWSTSRRINVPSITGSSPSWSSRQVRWVRRGCSRSQLSAVAIP